MTLLNLAGPLVLLFLGALSLTGLEQRTGVVDDDRDGLDDHLEQALLEKFVPAFHIDTRECDDSPAEFRRGETEPIVVAKNGTIYGQVFPKTSSKLQGSLVELHFYHLWARDCGQAGHALDAEHVSVLLQARENADTSDAWEALFWYAAAHEDTICDFSSAARASKLGAQDRGPDILISRGKHASFLSQRSCTWGCGGDVCGESRPLQVSRIINIGEPKAYLHGSLWVESKRWSLLLKLASDFTDELIAFLLKENLNDVVTLHAQLRPAQAILLAGGSTAGAVGVSGRKTGIALAEAGNGTDRALQATSDSLDKSQAATGGALATSATKTGRAVASAGGATGNAVAISAKNTGRSLRTAFKKTFSALGGSVKKAESN